MVSRVESEEFFRIRIELPSFQVELSSKDPSSTLPELRRILESLQLGDEVAYEEFVTQELKASFSEKFTTNQSLMGTVRKLLKEEEDYRIFTTDIPRMRDIDLDEEKTTIRIRRSDVRSQLASLAPIVQGARIRHGILHILGEIDRESKMIIADHIHKHMPTAQLRAFHSPQRGQKVGVECIFFGDFDESDEE